MTNIFTLSELAVIVNKDPHTLAIWAREGSLPCRKMGRVYVVERAVFLQSLSDGTLAEKFTVARAKQIAAAMTETPQEAVQ